MSFPVLVLHTYLLHRKHSLCHHYILKYVVLMLPRLYVHRAVGIGGAMPSPPDFGNQLTLFQRGGGGSKLCPPQYYFPSDF